MPRQPRLTTATRSPFVKARAGEVIAAAALSRVLAQHPLSPFGKTCRATLLAVPFVLRSVGAWVLLLVVAVCATGCAKESASAPVSVWVLRASNRAPTTVVLPAKLDRLLEQRPQTFRLNHRA